MNFLDLGIFLVLALVMLAAALLLVLPAFLHPRPPPADSSRRENIAAARARLSALQKQRDEGVLSAAEAADYETEIKRMLIEEVEETGDLPPAEEASPADKAGVAIVVAVLVPGVLALYFWLGTPSALTDSPAADAASSLSPPSLQEATAGLRRYIADNPQDGEALALMGRALSSMAHYSEAAEFFARARTVSGDTLPLLIANINALLSAAENNDADKENEVDVLLQKALSLSPDSAAVLQLNARRAEQKAANIGAAQ